MTMTATTQTVYNREQEITFQGELLGEGSSESPSKLRWYEVELWKTVDDRYVIHKIGVSEVDGEEDRHSAIVADTPEGAVRALYSRRPAGDYHLPLTAKRALDMAGDVDPPLREAFLHIDLNPQERAS